MKLKGIQAVVYEWVLQNPWRRRADACNSIPKQYMVTGMQVLRAHEGIFRKGILQKRYGGTNTVYAVREDLPSPPEDL